MKGLKITTASIVAALLAASVNSFAYTIPEDIKGTRFEEPLQVLGALGIMVGDKESGLIRPDDNIKRSEVAKMAVTALGLEDVANASSDKSRFPDVADDHWATGYINVAHSQGIVIGDPDGNFRPNDSITYAEAMAIMVRILGYTPVAENKGGFPSGYVVVGNEKGLNKNVNGSTNEAILRGDVAYMTYNALSVKLMEQKGFGSNITYEEVDKTLLFDHLGVTKGEGQITAIENSSLSGSSSLGKGEVQIGDDIFKTSYNINNFLGFNVVYYSIENSDGDNEIILVTPKKDRNTTVTITAELFDSITEKSGNKAISYFKSASTSKTNTAELDSEAILIYNGKAEELSDELINLKDKAGYINLLDTNKDSKYDIVFVTEYENMVVEEVTSTHKIVDKYGRPSLKLDPEDTSISFKITMGLEELKTSDLEEYDVLSIAMSKDKELIDVIVTRKSVSGKITEIDEDGVYIKGEHYKIANNFTDNLSIGTEATFYLDVEGKIAATNTALSAISENYAYLLRAYTDSNTETSSFKLYNSKGVEVSLEANEKIKFNGKSGVLASEVVSSLKENGETVKQLITYDVNSGGKISALNTAVDKTETGAVDKNHFTKNYVLTGATYNKKLGKIGNIKIDKDTIIFDIPSDSSSVSDYSIASIDMFEDEAKYDITVFDRQEDFTAKVIIVSNASFNTNADASIAVVNKISGATKDDDTETDKLYAFVDGKEQEIIADEKGILVKGDNKPLSNGDIIQYKTNDKGEIVNIRILFDVNSKDTEVETSPVDNLKTVYGKVTKKFADSINVSVNDNDVVNYALSEDVIVYSLDTSKSRNNIEVSDIGDIQKFNEDENNRVFIKLYKDVVTEVVIIK